MKVDVRKAKESGKHRLRVVLERVVMYVGRPHDNLVVGVSRTSRVVDEQMVPKRQ